MNTEQYAFNFKSQNIERNKRKPKFSGHQTFHFRYGWLEKGFDFAQQNKSFTDDNAVVELGVGKNMVESILYWCEVFGVVKNGCIVASQTESQSAPQRISPTAFGSFLLDKQTGCDPYLEDSASLWLLHWKLNTNPNFITSSSIIFSFINKNYFSKKDIILSVLKTLDQGNHKIPSEKVLLRDIDCYLRSYAKIKQKEATKSADELFDSPMSDLNLITNLDDNQNYSFSIGGKASIPAEIVGYAIADYLHFNNKNSMRIEEAMYSPYSPGQIFKLDEESLLLAINILKSDSIWESSFNYTESLGISLIHCNLKNKYDLLTYYYNKISK